MARAEFIALVAFLMATNALAIDIVLPAYPNLAEAFGLQDEADASQILVTYILGFGFGQLAFGPISDRYGRRKPLTWGLILYAATAFLCAIAPSYGAMLVLRFLQGAGASASRTIASLCCTQGCSINIAMYAFSYSTTSDQIANSVPTGSTK